MQETALGPPPAPPDGYHSRRRRSWCTVVIAGCCSPHGATAMNPVKPSPLAASQEAAAVPRDTLTITDNRTGKQYEIPITHNTIRALDLRQIDRKSTRLNSSHRCISYAVFCLKKKNKK